MPFYVAFDADNAPRDYSTWFTPPKETRLHQDGFSKDDLISCNSFIGHIFREILGSCGLMQKSVVRKLLGVTYYLNQESVDQWEQKHQGKKITDTFGKSAYKGSSGNDKVF